MRERREVAAPAALLLLLSLCLGGCATYSNDGQPSTSGTSTEQQPMQADTTSMSQPAASPTDTSSVPH